MSDRRASMLATLADIRSKPPTEKRKEAIRNIEGGLARIDAHAARAGGGAHARLTTTSDREKLMNMIDDASRSEAVRERAKALFNRPGGRLTEGDVEFLKRAG